MSEVKAELGNVMNVVFKEWTHAIIPIIEEVKAEHPSDLMTVRSERPLVRTAFAQGEQYSQGLLRIYKTLGAESTDARYLEEKLKDVAATSFQLVRALDFLEGTNDEIKQLNCVLAAELEKSGVVGLLIELAIDAMIEIVQWLLTKLNDARSMKEMKAIFKLVTHEDLDKQSFLRLKVWLAKIWLRKLVKHAKKVKASAPPDMETLDQEIRNCGIPGLSIDFGRFEYRLFITWPARLIRIAPSENDDVLNQLHEYPLWCEFEELFVQLLTSGMLEIIQAIDRHFTE